MWALHIWGRTLRDHDYPAPLQRLSDALVFSPQNSWNPALAGFKPTLREGLASDPGKTHKHSCGLMPSVVRHVLGSIGGQELVWVDSVTRHWFSSFQVPASSHLHSWFCIFLPVLGGYLFWDITPNHVHVIQNTAAHSSARRNFSKEPSFTRLDFDVPHTSSSTPKVS